MGSNGLSEESESFSNQVPWCSSSAKLAVHRPKRTLIPSKYKLSPYMIPQSKIIVSRLEADMYDVVLKMAENEHSNLSVIDYGHVVVKLGVLASYLKPQGNVHYFVMNALCRLLFHRKHPKKSYKHYFFSKVGDYLIGNHGPNDSKEKELFDNAVKCFKGASLARSLAYSQYLYFPILFQDRWYVVVVYLNRRFIYVLDSCTLHFGVGSNFDNAVRDEFVGNLTAVWKKAVNIDYGFHGYEIKYADVPQQTENFTNDSGILAMKNLELWDINVSLEDKFSEADTGHIRIKYVNDMIFNEYNYSTDGRSQVMEYDAKVYEKYYK